MNVFTTKVRCFLRNFLITVCMCFTVISCTRENFLEDSTPVYTGELVEATLSFTVPFMQVIGMPMNGNGTLSAPITRTVVASSGLETRVSNIWVFQFTADGTRQLGAPQYYTVQTINGKVQPVKLMLRASEDSQIYVVANINDATWGKGKESLSLAELNSQSLFFTSEQEVCGGNNNNLPMVALVKKQTIKAGVDSSPISIQLENLMAKVQFSYTLGDNVINAMHVTDVRLYNVPDRVQLGHALSDVTGIYPTEDDFESLDYPAVSKLQEGQECTWYIPQNLQGIIVNTAEKNKNEMAPVNALHIRVNIDSDLDGSSYAYTVYPGANVVNDFNLKNGTTYKVHVAINSGQTDGRVMASPANCFVMKTGSSLHFDPYDRKETGGGWKYSDYVSKTDVKKRIKSVDILWQTGDGTNFAIGNNQNHNLVKIEDDIVFVQTGKKEGNAVIAGYNDDGEIVWSWHIWVNNDTPAQLSKAIPYTTYQWGNEIVYTDRARVTGKSVMSRNLGALKSEPGDDPAQTYGLWYQWGRKDPFPNGSVEYYVNPYDYETSTIISVYNNQGKQIQINATTQSTDLFQTVETSVLTGTVAYVQQHPTHFINAPLTENDGDWFWGHNDCLWGGKPVSEKTKQIHIGESYLYDTGATEKSIFDPCPAGWMLAPADMWMGFTKSGLNTDDLTYENYNCQESTREENVAHRGYYLYMNGAKWDTDNVLDLKVSYFPSQGVRLGSDGKPMRNGMCGNYHTSTPGEGGHVAIFHLHTPGQIHILEPKGTYTQRATAGPVRCVRENE